ncbi:armadillo-type protein [Collybia nuda]|uniref:Nucleolar protein 9 n=1 Tax=Collybia nuda TaxID=64659 RepID=A0A9P5YF17_9AGAR|nr:armadillo-type protein [Collybia nuda]
MPLENRKRGKKHKKQPQEEENFPEVQRPIPVSEHELIGEPSWIRPTAEHIPETNPEAPFGYVDVDVKAYFRTVDIQIRDWQGTHKAGEDDDTDPNEQRHLFFVAALTEMGGKEKQLATDPDCSVILERMAYSMDDFVRRVFVDSLAGSYELLVRHRFASHVCQTLFTVARDTVSREMRGILPDVPEASGKGELRTLTQLILDASEELLPSFCSLIMDPFASHVIRALLLLLSPNITPSDEASALRSKKSATWKSRQGPMKSVFVEDRIKGKEALVKRTPAEFRQLARRFVETLRTELGENEVRALAANKVASPGLQMLLEVEADQDMAKDHGSLMDKVTVGIITACRDDSTSLVEPSDYLNTLLRDPTSSHLLETIVLRSPIDAFAILWSTYFKGKLARLASHPVANFVVAKALERVSVDQLSEACSELEGSWNKMIKTSRTGVLRAIIDRGATLHASEAEISQAVFSAFDLATTEDRKLLVPCVLYLMTLEVYILSQAALTTNRKAPPKPGKTGASNNGLEPKIQGAILLQSLLRLSEPQNQLVIDSISSLSMEERIYLAHDPTSSRVYDVLLESPNVPSKVKRQFVLNFIGHYHLLVDDRIGSRIGDRCWAYADTYLKEKVARSLISHEQFLAGSFYGKFFARNLNLYLLQRKPEDWRNMQAGRKRAQDQANAVASEPLPPKPMTVPPSQPSKRKRKVQPEDEIDAVFNATLGKRIKKAALDSTEAIILEERLPEAKRDIKSNKKDESGGLQDVLGAIRAAPKGEEAGGKKRH